MSTEITKMLVLSTDHLTEECCNDYLPDNNGVWMPKKDYGWFVYVHCEGPGDDMLPASLCDCLDFAKDQGCEWIMFDCDGPRVEGLTDYEW